MNTGHTPRTVAEALDRADPLAPAVALFEGGVSDRIYMDGNSLGRASTRARIALVEMLDEWSGDLVRGWERWIDLPAQAGDRLGAALLGARPGEVLVADSTTVNLYKLAAAAIDALPHRRVIVTDEDNFPTDRYVLEGLATQRGSELRMFAGDAVEGPDETALAEALGADVALVCLSHVGFRSGAIADMAGLTSAVHDAGALVLWDLSHSVGSVPIDLTGTGVDLAVGCTYKYLNAGPGAPAFLYVRRELQGQLRQPVWGWFGQRDQFAMERSYAPASGIAAFASGTPNILGTALVDAGVANLAAAGIHELRAKAVSLTELFVTLHDERLAPLGFSLGSPRRADRRGAHVSLRHAHALSICRALIERSDVVPDFRPPDCIRFGMPAAYTRYVDVWDAVDRLHTLVMGGDYRDVDVTDLRVT